MKRLLDSLLSRWYVRRSLLDVSIDNTTQALRIIDEWKQYSGVHDAWLYGRDFGTHTVTTVTTPPSIIVTTDYKQAPCS